MLATTSTLSTSVATLEVTSRDTLLSEFIQQSGFAEHTIEPLAGDASFRRYVRVLTPQTSYIVMDSPPDKLPVRPFVEVCDYLSKQGHSAPRIVALDEELGFLLLEDLGDDLFNSVLADEKTGESDKEKELYNEAIELLIKWHQSEAFLKDTSGLAINSYTFDEYMRELKLFTDWYLPEIENSEAIFHSQEFLGIWSDILHDTPLGHCYFVHRDFHADNLLWLADRDDTKRVGLLDFQDALWGDPSYDLVSLLEDARRDVDPALAEEMKQLYVERSGQPKELFEARYAIMGAQRNLKIIGIFMRLNKRDGKPGYLDYLPRVWNHLEKSLAHPALAKLKIWLDTYVPPHLR